MIWIIYLFIMVLLILAIKKMDETRLRSLSKRNQLVKTKHTRLIWEEKQNNPIRWQILTTVDDVERLARWQFEQKMVEAI